MLPKVMTFMSLPCKSKSCFQKSDVTESPSGYEVLAFLSPAWESRSGSRKVIERWEKKQLN